jgi:pyruvate formate lyase activating enzyme
MREWIVGELAPDVHLRLTAFHPAWRMRETPPTPLPALRAARRTARENGLLYAHVGNARACVGPRQEVLR